MWQIITWKASNRSPSPCCSDVNDLQSFDLWNAGPAGCWMFEASSASRR